MSQVENMGWLHSALDLRIEDEIGRAVTLEESKLIGLAMKLTLDYARKGQTP